MCLAVYLASDRPRRQVRNPPGPPVFSIEVEPPDSMVRVQFSKPNVYYVGSDTNCSCGFRQEPDWVLKDMSDDKRRDTMANQQRLHDYIAECLLDEDSIELFVCWEGEEADPPFRRRTIRVADLLASDYFYDDQRAELVVVNK